MSFIFQIVFVILFSSLQEKEGIKFTKVHVSGLPPNVNEAVLFDHFKTFGQIHCVNIVRDKLTGISRGFGFVSLIMQFYTLWSFTIFTIKLKVKI